MKLLTKEVKIGIAGIISLFILVYGINYLKGISLFKSSSYYYVRFHDINGLATSSPVFANGFRVGLVRNLIYDYAHPGNIIVQIDVAPDLRIPKGSTAELTADMLGAMKMSLQLPETPDGTLQVGDTLSGHFNGGVLSEAANMMPELQKLMPKLDSIMTSLNAILGNPAIPATLDNIENLTASLHANSRHLEGFLQNDLPSLTSKMSLIGDNFIQLSDQLKQIDYDRTMQQINSTLQSVEAVTQKLERKDNTVGLLLNDPSLYDNLNETARNAASLLQDLQTHPKKYVHFSIFGRKN